ncbi:hypothetical protein JW848_07415 [Candidatus Bipolaricaulota bacterium]|nr:hypothetical protein [Candidatus Bipolaricaulota bacterium]
MSLADMLLRSELKREKVVPGEIERMLSTVRRRLQDADHGDIHPETRLEQAYHAILGCALIALRAHDLRTTNRPGHHMVALESLEETVGLPIDRIDYFQTLRDLRNKDLYTGGTHIGESQAREAVEEAGKLAEDLEVWLATRARPDGLPRS